MNKTDTSFNFRFIARTIFLTGAVLLLVLNFKEALSTLRWLYKGFSSIIVGFGIAFILNILVTFYDSLLFSRTKSRLWLRIRRPLTIILSILTISAILIFIISIVTPQLVQSITILSNGLPRLIDNMIHWLAEAEKQIAFFNIDINQLTLNQNNIITSIRSFLQQRGGGILSAVSSFLSGTVSFVLSFIFAIYALFSKEDFMTGLKHLLKAFLSEYQQREFLDNMQVVYTTFTSFITGQVKEAFILGTFCGVGMLIFGFPYAGMIGIVIGVTSLLPVIGTYIGGGIGFLLIAIINPTRALWFILYLVIIQQIENSLIYPRVVGDSIGLPAVWVFITITVGGALFGLGGIFFGVPLAAAAYAIGSKYLDRRIARITGQKTEAG